MGTKTYAVKFPAGIRPGQKLRLQGLGGQGDLYLEVDLKPHDRFRLEGLDLYTELPISPWEAALGGEVTVKTLDGSIKLKIPPGSSSGRKIRLRQKGFPNAKGADGDLYAEIRVVVPEQLSGRERELFSKLAKVSSFKPR